MKMRWLGMFAVRKEREEKRQSLSKCTAYNSLLRFSKSNDRKCFFRSPKRDGLSRRVVIFEKEFISRHIYFSIEDCHSNERISRSISIQYD